MKNYWYISTPKEVFIDLDGDRTNRLVTVLARIRGIMESHKFPIRNVWMFPSQSDNHFHLVLSLNHECSIEVRTALQLYCFSDVFRTCNNLMRYERMPAADVLISNLNWYKVFGFYRMPDSSCLCKGKHNNDAMQKCVAAKELRGKERAFIYFDKPVAPEDFFMKKFGKIK